MADYQEIVRASNTDYSADETQWPSADGGLLENLVWVYEPVGTIVTADDTDITADALLPTADGGELTGALDLTDAEVIPATAVAEPGGGGFLPRPRPYPVEGYGYGVLPQLEGEAYGVVAAAGRSVGQIRVSAAAVGAHAVVGDGAAIGKLKADGFGAAAARGQGNGIIIEFKGAAIGRFDDDEAAVIALLLAA